MKISDVLWTHRKSVEVQELAPLRFQTSHSSVQHCSKPLQPGTVYYAL